MYFDISFSGKIITSFAADIDASTDMKALHRHFAAHPARWNTAFGFLSQFTRDDVDKEQIIRDLHRGRINLSADVYVNIEDYMPKPVDLCRYESHRRYIDIQYVIQGCECIGLTRDTNLPVLAPYDENKDIVFYQYKPQQLLLADPTKYFVFFPTDLHAPGIKVAQDSAVTRTEGCVTKIVVKILL